MFLSLIFHSKSCIQNCLNSSIRDTVLVTTATITISNIFYLSQGSSHNNIVKLQSDNIRDKKIIFLALDHLKRPFESQGYLGLFFELVIFFSGKHDLYVFVNLSKNTLYAYRGHYIQVYRTKQYFLSTRGIYQYLNYMNLY